MFVRADGGSSIADNLHSGFICSVPLIWDAKLYAIGHLVLLVENCYEAVISYLSCCKEC